ncbi:MAG: hypothetical protein AAB324_01070, partial [candidate division NC10 bacterium]
METETQTVDAVPRHLIGVRIREPLQAEEYLVEEFNFHVGAFCIVETATGTALGEVRRPKRRLPESQR